MDWLNRDTRQTFVQQNSLSFSLPACLYVCLSVCLHVYVVDSIFPFLNLFDSDALQHSQVPVKIHSIGS